MCGVWRESSVCGLLRAKTPLPRTPRSTLKSKSLSLGTSARSRNSQSKRTSFRLIRPRTFANQLGYLTDAAARVGRFDWKNLATSTFIEIVLTLGLDVEKTQKLLALVTHLLGPLVMGVAGFLGR